ncbi:unnamed protein product [Alopecurus aequalis]
MAAPPDELIEEILLRLPPNEPSCLLRASLVCKPWRRIILHHRFRHRLHELHGRPPVPGFLRNNKRVFGCRNQHDCGEEGEDLQWTTWACSYSSETGEWSDVNWIQDSDADFTMHTTSVLVGDSLLYFLSDQGTIIEYEYDLANGENNATTILRPLELEGNNLVALILTEDGRLGIVDSIPTSRLNIWSRVDMLWVNSRVILLNNLLPTADLGEVCPMSFAERVNTIFMRTVEGIFTIELRSERARKVREDDDESDSLVPIETFYTPRAS